MPNPSGVKDLRPISCCNTIYKCIIIANRFQLVLPDLEGKQQTAFVQGRRIGDNILLAQELLRNSHRNKGTPRCALKVDLMKTYDTVRWDFVGVVLNILGFPERVVQWIRECISTPRFYISINGELNGFFPGERALRQGDPMSPYIFVLVMEAFSGLLSYMANQGRFSWRCQKEKITHICFSDDLLIFCKGEVSSISLIKDCLSQFKDISGLSPNPDKSKIFSCGVNEAIKNQLLGILGFINEGSLPIRDLVVPLISSRLKKSDCKSLVDRIVTRARSWASKVLSYAGRLQLVNSILFAIQTYWFILPKGVIKQVDQVLRAFLWKGSDLNHGGAKVAWDKVCLPKQEGGLGIQNF